MTPNEDERALLVGLDTHDELFDQWRDDQMETGIEDRSDEIGDILYDQECDEEE